MHVLVSDIRKTYTFRDRVRARDQRCVISLTDTSLFQFIGLQAAHIIPRSHSRYVIILFDYSHVDSGR